MSLQKNIKYQITENMQTQQLVMDELLEHIEFAAQQIVNALLSDKKVLSCGNGASVSSAQYFVSLMVNRYARERPSLPAISLNNDVQMLTSIASTQHYDDIYAKQLRALSQNSDVLLLYCVQEGSLNLVKLMNAAHDQQVSIVLLTGEGDGSLPALLQEQDVCISVPSQSAQRVHETQLLITHCLCDLIDSQLFGNQIL